MENSPSPLKGKFLWLLSGMMFLPGTQWEEEGGRKVKLSFSGRKSRNSGAGQLLKQLNLPVCFQCFNDKTPNAVLCSRGKILKEY